MRVVTEHPDGTFSYIQTLSHSFHTEPEYVLSEARVALNNLHEWYPTSMEDEASEECVRAHHTLTRSSPIRVRVFRDRSGSVVRVELVEAT